MIPSMISLDRLAFTMDNGAQPKLDGRHETLLGIARGVQKRGERFEDPLQEGQLGEVRGGAATSMKGKKTYGVNYDWSY